jgi:hypothetical protein
MIYLYSECANKTLCSFCHWMGLELMQTHSSGEFDGNKALFSDCKYLINKSNASHRAELLSMGVGYKRDLMHNKKSQIKSLHPKYCLP